jgi:hypothetical protein
LTGNERAHGHTETDECAGDHPVEEEGASADTIDKHETEGIADEAAGEDSDSQLE